jgi:hypothetical protein
MLHQALLSERTEERAALPPGSRHGGSPRRLEFA